MLDALRDVTVLDLTSNVAGPFATMILADLGATVWKVEPPEGDVVRGWPPFGRDEVSTTFVALNRGKRSVVLDLKTEPDRTRLLELAARADVVVSSLRPGALARLGLGADELRRRSDKLVISEISAFGGHGARGEYPGFDAIMQAYTGLMDLTGHQGEPPARVGTAILDIGTGMWCALGVIASLYVRDGRGVAPPAVSATLFGTAAGFLAHHVASAELADVVPSRIGTAQHNTAPYETVPASDGMIMVGVTSPALWLRFVTAIDAPELLEDPRFTTNADRVAHRAALNDAIAVPTSSMSCEELTQRLEAAGVPCSKVRNVAELVADPQLEVAGLWEQSAHGGRVIRTPVELNGFGSSLTLEAPALGADTQAMLALLQTPPHG